MNPIIHTAGAVALALGLVAVTRAPLPAVAQSTSAEQRLADRFAPIASLKEQAFDCDTAGEPYLPLPVEIVLNDPDVAVKQHPPVDATPGPDRVVKMAPSAQDLAGKDGTYYLDFPGKSRQPGCDYESWYRQRVEETGLQPSVYARVATEPDRPGKLALQYWFYWVFNDFNNTHESDWEMIQFTFDANSAAEALTQEPTALAFAQHGGGEHGDWDDEKIQRDGDHPIVYPAAGSHATYYQGAVWLGWGEQGSGFGCDTSDPPAVETPLRVVLIPETADPTGPFAWTHFGGRWGERQSWEYNGPKGPNLGKKWSKPISWTDDLREESLPAPHSQPVGPGPTRFFCAMSGFGGTVMTYFPVHPKIVGTGLAIAVAFLVILALRTWRYVARAATLYVRHPGIFLVTAILLLPVAALGTAIENLIARSAIGREFFEAIEQPSIGEFVLGMGFGGIQSLLVTSLVAPAIIHATYDLVRSDPTSLRESWETALRRLPTVLGAIALNTALLLLMSLTVILAPLAFLRAVQWLFAGHAVIIDGSSARRARHVSRAAVKGDCFRTLGMAILIGLISGVPGPLVGALALVVGHVSLGAADVISSLAYAIAYPLAIIASTLYYLRIHDQLKIAIADPLAAAPAAPMPVGLSPASPGTP